MYSTIFSPSVHLPIITNGSRASLKQFSRRYYFYNPKSLIANSRGPCVDVYSINFNYDHVSRLFLTSKTTTVKTLRRCVVERINYFLVCVYTLHALPSIVMYQKMFKTFATMAVMKHKWYKKKKRSKVNMLSKKCNACKV